MSIVGNPESNGKTERFNARLRSAIDKLELIVKLG